jgi:hypothetical protein
MKMRVHADVDNYVWQAWKSATGSEPSTGKIQSQFNWECYQMILYEVYNLFTLSEWRRTAKATQDVSCDTYS